MKTIKQHIDSKLKEMADKLQPAVKNDPADFYCGHTMGYKQALLDMIHFIEESKQALVIIKVDQRTTWAAYEKF